MNRRALLKASLFASPFVAGGIFAQRTLSERHRIDLQKQALEIGLDRPVRAAVIGDLHFDPLYETEFLDRVMQTIRRENPDLLLLTGDYVSHSADRIGELAELLATVNPSLGRYAVLGNHDHWSGRQALTRAFEQAGVRVLCNESVPLDGIANAYVSGLESYWAGKPHAESIRATAADSRHLTLVHEPDAFDELTDPRIALQMSGHTHGGQVRMPGYGALILPKWGRRYQMGLYQRGSRHLYVNRGIGTVDQHVRFHCPPEVTLLDLS